MQFRISDTFTDSLARLTGEEQKVVKTTAFDLQMNPANPSLNFHKLDKAKDKRFWSVRANLDLRLIVHKSEANLLLCYVAHHDKAYEWAERRKLETHPSTGAAQWVEIRETVSEVIIPVYVHAEVAPPAKPKAKTASLPIFAGRSDAELLGYGVPSEWLSDVKLATSTTILALSDHLPAEAAEALLELATGGKPRVPVALPAANPFDHPDAQRRFRVMRNVDELTRAMEFPWDKWTVFLHPEQQQWVSRDYSGPARISGSAGTGKTIVALHRAAFLARSNTDARVLLTTFSDTLAHSLQSKLKRLLGNEPRLAERIDVYSLDTISLRLFKTHIGPVAIASRAVMSELLADAAKAAVPAAPTKQPFSKPFLLSEWEQVVDTWQLRSWPEYRDVTRLGRKTRLPEVQRAALWAIFAHVQAALQARGLRTMAELYTALAASFAASSKTAFDYIVVDEAQDLSVSQLRFLAALAGTRQKALFFAGDLGQRIFQPPFSWKSLGVDIRGRARTLRVNYRTSHQIRAQADRLLGPMVTDVDGNSEDRSDTISVFNGPAPTIQICKSAADEAALVSRWLAEQSKRGVLPHEFGVFVRSAAELARAENAVKQAGLMFKVLDEHVETASGHVAISTMHLAKGLEFRAVVVMACDDEILPLQERIESVGDEADLREVYESERQLLYVACTRARDQLLVTGVAPTSEFLSDML